MKFESDHSCVLQPVAVFLNTHPFRTWFTSPLKLLMVSRFQIESKLMKISFHSSRPRWITSRTGSMCVFDAVFIRIDFNTINQSKHVSGQISLTCDAWQASNTDRYFAVTGHWIEEWSQQWKLEHGLLGFTRMNTAHNGKQLGQALFKICFRLGIVHKVCPFKNLLAKKLWSHVDWSHHLQQCIQQWHYAHWVCAML